MIKTIFQSFVVIPDDNALFYSSELSHEYHQLVAGLNSVNTHSQYLPESVFGVSVATFIGEFETIEAAQQYEAGVIEIYSKLSNKSVCSLV